MSNARIISMLVAWAIAGCNGQPRSSGPERQTMTRFRGTLHVDDAPIRAADLFLLDRGAKVVAATRSDELGGWELPAPAGWSGGSLLAKLYEPVAGARAVPLGADDQVLDVRVHSADAVTLSGDITWPAGVTPDWVEVSITPRQLDGVPAEAKLALLAVDTGPALRGTYLAKRATEPRFQFRVLPGTWDLRVIRNVDAPPESLPIPNLEQVSLTLPDGSHPALTVGFYRLEARHDLHVQVALDVAR